MGKCKALTQVQVRIGTEKPSLEQTDDLFWLKLHRIVEKPTSNTRKARTQPIGSKVPIPTML